ncbi:MAG: helix-turn-helix domain-containing protein [Firmicutes bacterium]|nr:helix-turn-helix domain-containing protein [Bacillota bacterium]
MEQEQKKTFGQFLLSQRNGAGLTQRQLADKLFVDESTISKWEKDARRPDIEFVSKLSEIFGISESELIQASVDKSRIREKKESRRYRAIVNAYMLTFICIFGTALLVTFIVNLAVGRTLDWFFIVLAAIIVATTHLILPKFIKSRKLLLMPVFSLGSLWQLLIVINIFVGSPWWFFIPFMSTLLLYSLIFVPIIVHKYPLPEFIKKFRGLLLVGLYAVLTLLLLVLIDIYATVFGESSFGWSFAIGFVIILFWALLLTGTVFLFVHTKLNIRWKFAIAVFAWIVMINVFYGLLHLFGIESGHALFWNACFTEWTGEHAVHANVMLIINILMMAISLIFATLAVVDMMKRRRIKE